MSSLAIPDGEYEIDMSSLFSSSTLSDIFGIRYGFKPDNVDDDYYSLMIKDLKDDSYMLRTESKDFGKSVVTTNNHKLNHIFFEGKAPNNIPQQQPSTTNLNPNSNSSSNSVTSNGNSANNHSEYILIYDEVRKLFKMERYGGAIKLGKSREPELLNKKINELSSSYAKLSKNEYIRQSGGFTTMDLIDTLIKNANSTNTNTTSNGPSSQTTNNHNGNPISYRKSINGISPMRIPKKKLAPSTSQTNTPLGTPKFAPIASPSVGQLSRSATPTPPTSASSPAKPTPPPATTTTNSATSLATSSATRKRPAISGTTTAAAGTKIKRSKLLRAAERAVRSNKKARNAPIEPPAKSLDSIKKIPKLKGNAGLGISSASASALISGTGTPLATESDIEEIKLGSPITLSDKISSSKQSLGKSGKVTENNDGLSDEDIELMASELEEELGGSSEEDRKTITSTTTTALKSIPKPKPQSIVEVMQGEHLSPMPKESKSSTNDEVPRVIVTKLTTSETKPKPSSTVIKDDDDDDWDVDLSDWDDVADEDDQLGELGGGFQVIVDENPTLKSSKENSPFSPEPPEYKKSIAAPDSARIQTPALDSPNPQPHVVAKKTAPKKQAPKIIKKTATTKATKAKATTAKKIKKKTTATPKPKATKRPPPPQPVRIATDEAVDEAFAELDDEGSDNIDDEFDEEFDKALEDLDDEDEDEVSEEE